MRPLVDNNDGDDGDDGGDGDAYGLLSAEVARDELIDGMWLSTPEYVHNDDECFF